MKKILIILICLSLFLSACDRGNSNAPADPVSPIVETDVQGLVDPASDEPILVLKEEMVEIAQGSAFDPVRLIESGNYDKISFSSIDTSVVGEQNLTITIVKSGKKKEYTVIVDVIRPKAEVSWTMHTEGPLFLIHPDKLTGYEGEENYKSFYEYPVFTSNPAEVAELMNQVILEEHIYSIADTFERMGETMSPEYGQVDILQAKTKISEAKEAIVVHTENLWGMYQSGYQVLSHVVTVFDKATGHPLSNQEQLARYGLDAQTLIEKLEVFIAEQEYSTGKMGLEPFRLDMASEDVWEYMTVIHNNLPSDEYAVVFLEDEFEVGDLQPKLIFIEEGKLFCEFCVYEYTMTDSAIKYLLFEVGPLE